MIRFLTLAIAAISATGIHSIAAESTAADSVLTMTLTQVDVTAIKSGPALSSQPVASTTVTGLQAERYGIVTVKEGSKLVPNFYIPDYGTRMTSSIYVRGLGARIDQPVVGLNVDNVVYMNKDDYDFDLPDIARMEVLRGPQSVLYGRNTMGGVINIHTLSPLEWQGVKAMAALSVPFGAKASVGLYRRITDALAMSVTGYYTHSAGRWHNDYNNSRIGAENAGSVRWKTVIAPHPTLSVQNVAALQLNSQNGYPYEQVGTGRIAYNDTCFYHRVSFTDGLTINWRPSKHVTHSAITGFRYMADNMTIDNDFTPADYFTLVQRRREWSLTQDIVVRGTTPSGRYGWLAGIFAFYRTGHMDAPVTFGDTGIAELIEGKRNDFNPYYPISWDSRTFPLDSRFFTPDRGAAVYHQSTLNLGRWQFTAALRLDYERPSLSYSSSCLSGYSTIDAATGLPYRHQIVDILRSGHLSMSFTQLLPRVSLKYDLPRSVGNIYATFSKGYKAGGYNSQMFSDILQQDVMEYMGIARLYDVDQVVSYRPEWSWNYEVGAHLTTPSGGLRGSLAAFWIDCHDQQLSVFPEGTVTGRMMTNAGRTRSIGIEASAEWQPTTRWNLSAAYGYTDARFRRYDNGREDFHGRHVPYAPQNTLWMALRHTVPLQKSSLRHLEFFIDASAIGPVYWDEANTQRQPFYVLSGAGAILRADLFDIELRGTNITDTHYAVFSFTSIGHHFIQRGKGATTSLTLRLHLPR